MNVLRLPLFREATTALLVAGLLLQSATAVAPGPAWWGTQTVLDPYAVADDFAVANAGQLKYMATHAMQAMDAELPDGAGVDIHLLVDPWLLPPAAGATRDNYLAVNQGQLKHVATPFYDRLGLPYPWAGSSGVRDNYLLVNLGQLKHVFSFALNFRTAGQGPVTIPAATLQTAVDAWNALAVKPANSTADDLDGDGISNLQEYLMENALFDPNDIDGDRILDTVEDAHPGVLSKLNFADAVWDHDADGSVEYDDANGTVQFHGDGVMNFEELLLALNMNAATTSTRTDGLSDAEVLVWTLAMGGGLTPVSDPVHAFWATTVNADWLSANFLEDYSNWLVDAEAFREDVLINEYWSPNPGVWLIQGPGVAHDVDWNIIDLDGDGALDTDRDGDGLPDLWEYRYQLNLRVNDTQEDPDADNLTNQQEYQAGTNPRLADSDGDGFKDGAEVLEGSDPLDGWTGVSLTLALVSKAIQYVGTGGSSPPLMVKVTQGGQPVFGVSVEFAVSQGGGLLQSNSGATTPDTRVTVTTDSKGTANVSYLAGTTPGSAGVTATLTEAGASQQSVSFNLNILAGLADSGSTPPVLPWGGEPEHPPPEPDADGDGIPDKWEIANGLDPEYSNVEADEDLDGFSDVEEYQMGSDLYDFNSRPRASIEVRDKTYGSHYAKFTSYGADGTAQIQKTFYGEARLDGGETYLYVSMFDGSYVNYNSSDRSEEMRSKFVNGGYDNLNAGSGWPQVPLNDPQFVWSDAFTTGDPDGSAGSKEAGGTAMELRLIDPTSTGAPAEDWSRTYLVVEYSGGTDEYPTFASMPLNKVLGSLNFSRTADGTKSVTFSGDASGQVKISGNDRVEIIPNEVMGQTSRIQLYSVELDLAIPKEEGDITLPVLAATNNNWAMPSSGSPEVDLSYQARVVPKEKKATEGGWVVLNFDDDDGRGNYEHGNTSATPDLEYSGAITKENDLIRVGIKKVDVGSGSTVSYRFKFNSGNIRLWKKPDRSEQVVSEQTEFTIPTGMNYAVAYVEGLKPHDDDEGTMITGQIKVGTGNWVDGDKAKVRVPYPIISLFMEGWMWSRSDAEPIANFAKGRITKDARGNPDPLFLRTVVNTQQGDTFLIAGVNEAKKNVCYSITGLFEQTAYKAAKLALKTENTHIAFNGHANWGVGFAFGTNFGNFNQFFWAAGGGQAACNTHGFEEHLQLSPWNDKLIAGFSQPNFAVAQIWNGMHDPNAQNRLIKGIPVDNIQRFPNMENPVVQPGQAFQHHKETMRSRSQETMDLLYHYTADPAVDGDGANDHRSILKQPGDSDVPANLKYKSLMLTQCNSYRSFIESFKHGRVIGTWNFVGNPLITMTYVKDTVEGKTAAGIKTDLDSLERGNPTGGDRGMFESTDF